MAEWFKAPVLKTGVGQLTVGSNPSLSAKKRPVHTGLFCWRETVVPGTTVSFGKEIRGESGGQCGAVFQHGFIHVIGALVVRSRDAFLRV